MRRYLKQLSRPLFSRWLQRAQFLQDARSLGIRKGGTLLVHSSMSALGYVHGGPSTVLAWLTELVGPEGTLVLPSHTWSMANAGGRTFDVRETPSCVGVLSDTFWRQPGSVRSLHPSHSVAACGIAADELTRDHIQASTPCGSGTPYARLLAAGGQVLLLGVGLKSHTAFHTVEALADVKYLMDPQPKSFTIIDAVEEAR